VKDVLPNSRSRGHLVDEGERHLEVAAPHLVPAQRQQGAWLGLIRDLHGRGALLAPLQLQTQLDVAGAHVDGRRPVLICVALLAAPEVAVALAGTTPLPENHNDKSS
jgi:hypothetical protein